MASPDAARMALRRAVIRLTSLVPGIRDALRGLSANRGAGPARTCEACGMLRMMSLQTGQTSDEKMHAGERDPGARR